MEYCSECNAVEQGFTEVESEEGEDFTFVCKNCGCEDTREFCDEDYYKDRD